MIAFNDVQNFEIDYSAQSVQQTAIYRIVKIDIKPGSETNGVNLESKA